MWAYSRVAAAHRRDLQEGHPALVLGIRFEEPVVSEESVDEALAVVETVDADHATPAEQARNHALHRLVRLCLGGRFAHRLDVDADRDVLDHRVAAAGRNAAVRADRVGPPEVDHRRAEALDVALRLEGDEVEFDQPPHDLAVHRQGPQRLDVRKRDVQEEPD